MKKTREVVINNCYGGFSLSRKAFLRLRELGDETALQEPDIGEYYSDGSGPKESHLGDMFHLDIERDSPLLVQVVKELKKEANGMVANLKIVKIPIDADWQIENYDGLEWISEKHRTWS